MGRRSKTMKTRGCSYFESRALHAAFIFSKISFPPKASFPSKVSIPSCFISASNTTVSPNLASGRFVIMNGTSITGCSFASISSICIFIPPLHTTLSFRPLMRKCRPSGAISAMSLVTSVEAHTSGAFIMRHPSFVVLTFTLANGSYHELASGPLRRRKAMCDRVSVMP